MTETVNIARTVIHGGTDIRHLIGFDVRFDEWQQTIREQIKARDSSGTLFFQEEDLPRGDFPSEKYIWVWIVMTQGIPPHVPEYLIKLHQDPQGILKLRPDEYP